MMGAVSVPWKTLLLFGLSLTSLVVYNEFLVYYLVLIQCTWPVLDSTQSEFSDFAKTSLKAMVLADTHLIGSREGHWFDRLRREWQMERAFQTSMTIHAPDVTFVLGDLFDEGKWCSDAEFEDYIHRFERMFRVPDNTQMQVVVGNHDIGFHYMVDRKKQRRFASAFSTPSVRMLRLNGVIFIQLNSMAFEGDNCEMCSEARRQLSKITKTLSCAKEAYTKTSCINEDLFTYTKPVILQHFPLFRTSDANCSGVDSAPPEEKHKHMKPKWDTLSPEASSMLLDTLQPRLVISGHTHHFCQTWHPGGTTEWTVPSFSWRNIKTPSFLLLTINGDHHEINKCFMPSEITVVYTYIIGVIFILLIFLCQRPNFLINRSTIKRQ